MATASFAVQTEEVIEMRELAMDEVAVVGGGLIGADDGSLLCGFGDVMAKGFIGWAVSKTYDIISDTLVSGVKNLNQGGTPNGTDPLGNVY